MGVEPTTSALLNTASFHIDYKAYAFFYGIRNPSVDCDVKRTKGFEPSTIGLENRDSTAELHSQRTSVIHRMRSPLFSSVRSTLLSTLADTLAAVERITDVVDAIIQTINLAAVQLAIAVDVAIDVRLFVIGAVLVALRVVIRSERCEERDEAVVALEGSVHGFGGEEGEPKKKTTAEKRSETEHITTIVNLEHYLSPSL
jgi:hypothetical protein